MLNFLANLVYRETTTNVEEFYSRIMNFCKNNGHRAQFTRDLDGEKQNNCLP
jgi:hypothetical protein